MSTSTRKLLLGCASATALIAFATSALAQDQMETVVVTGIRASLQSAQKIKQDSDQVVDSITAVDIGALPDRNIAEALQRVPGVTLQRNDAPADLTRMGSTGQTVFIRGLAWVKSLVNGRDEFTAVAGRTLSFGDVSADLMQAVNIYKSPTASQIEGGVGGTIDLITRKPFDQDGMKIAVSGDYTYGQLIDVAVPSGNALFSDRWNTGIGEIGVLASVDWQEVVNRTEGVNLQASRCWNKVPYTGADGSTVAVGTYQAPTDSNYNQCMGLNLGTNRLMGTQVFAWRQMEFTEKRLASNLVLQWRPSEKLEFTLFAMNTYAQNQDIEHYDASAINWTQFQAGTFNNSVWTGGPGTLTSIDTRGGSGHNRDTDISLNVKFIPTDNLEVTADVQAVESDSPYRNMTFYTQASAQPTVTLDYSHDTPKITVQDLASNQDAGNYIFPFAMDHMQYNSAHVLNARLDATYKFGGDGVFGFFKSVSVGARTEQKLAVSRSTDYNWSFIIQGWFGNGSWMALDGNIHCYSAPCAASYPSADGNTYTSATGAMKTAVNQAELFHYHTLLGNSLPALWVPKASLALMNEVQSYNIMKAYEPGTAMLQGWWSPGDQTGNQWKSYAAEHGCTGSDTTCLAAYDNSPGSASAGNLSSRQAEQTYAGYAQLDYGYDRFLGYDVPIDGNIGLRIVRTEDQVGAGNLVMPHMDNTTCTVGNTANQHQSSSCDNWWTMVQFLGGSKDEAGRLAAIANQGTLVPRPAVKSGYTDFLPSFNFRAKLSDTVQTRLAYSETIMRPNFNYTYSGAHLSFSFQDANGPDYGVFLNGAGGNGGNPFLKPMKARNYDGSIEWYFSPSGSLTLSLFHKDLTNYIFTATTTVPITDPVTNQVQDFNYTTYVNGDKGKVEGFELAYQQFFDQLPGFWSGFGFQANYTKIYNSGGHNTGNGDLNNATSIASANDKTLPLEGMSNDSYNLALMYGKYGIDARLAYNWRSHYLSSSSEANNKVPLWLENYGQLDGSVFYDIMDHYKIGLQVTNILALPFYSDMGYKDFHPRVYTIDADRKFAIVLRTSW